MTNHFDKLTRAFSGFRTTTRSRPDGGLLFELHNDDGRILTRAISYMQLHNSLQMEWLISSIKRDQALDPAELPTIAGLQSQQRFAMPTYICR